MNLNESKSEQKPYKGFRGLGFRVIGFSPIILQCKPTPYLGAQVSTPESNRQVSSLNWSLLPRTSTLSAWVIREETTKDHMLPIEQSVML